MVSEPILGLVAGTGILALLAIDLGLVQRNAHELSLKTAVTWSLIWISFALGFNVLLYFTRGGEPALEFLSGFLIEKSLSVDNLFVFLLIFNYFRVPVAYQHKVLFWGIFGAVIMRGALIWLGLQLLESFRWLTYVLGTFLIFTGIKTARGGSGEEINLEKNPLLNFLRRFLPVSHEYEGANFFSRSGKRITLTPLFIVLIMIETTDVLFALDSVPAILGITSDPLVLYSSNLFAILGLRALYFVLAGLFGIFHYLKFGVSAVLVFVGGKMTLHHFYEISDPITLLVIGILLGASIWASYHFPEKAPLPEGEPAPERPLQ